MGRLGSSLVRAAILVLSLLGCSMSDYRPEKFFEGQQLEAARAIDANDMTRLRNAARGLEIDKPGRENITLLWFAMLKKRFDAIRTLIELGSNPDKQVVQGLGTPINSALNDKNLWFLASILDGGFPVDFATQEGSTLLYKAAGVYGASLDHVKLLVERGANLNAKDSLGDTPLSAALDTQQPDRAKYLLQQGASIEVYSLAGATPAWTVHRILGRLSKDSPLRPGFEEVRDLMIAKGAVFPPDPPDKVRAWMKSKGMKVAE
jgi:ankyrin repeat protein